MPRATSLTAKRALGRWLAVHAVLAVLGFATIASAQDDPASRMWQEVEPEIPEPRFDFFGLIPRTQPARRPATYREFRLDVTALEEALSGAAPLGESAAAVAARPVRPTIAIPMPEGGVKRFAVEPAAVLAPELAAKYPMIRLYRGVGIDDPRQRARVEVLPQGFSAQIDDARGAVLVSPTEPAADYLMRADRYATYGKSDAPARESRLTCNTPGTAEGRPGPIPDVRWGDELRTYRLAVAATGEYVAAVGGTKAAALGAIGRTVNRVDEIYEREVAIRLQLIGDTDKLIFLDPATDGLDNEHDRILIEQSQQTIDRIIGDARYDIGHTLSTGAGGRAGVGVVGRSGDKARGVTGTSQPFGDAFDVDYVAHEMGHQFGATHTFNGVEGACRDNRSEDTAYEPGSGSTILSYAGICVADDIQRHSDDYFHAASLEQITRYVRAGGGETPNRVATGDAPPVVDAGADATIPVRTPFRLEAKAADPDDPASNLTYAWEELDLGPQAQLIEPDDGNVPIFRSFKPTTSPSRSFPGVRLLAAGASSAQEKIPQLPRASLFRVTVRDNRQQGAFASDDVALTVAANAGPFQIVAPVRGATLSGLARVRWDVAGTDKPPIGADSVRIVASADGGTSFPFVLAAKTSNDGSELVTLPNQLGALLIKVESVGNVFFALAGPVTLGSPEVTVVLVRHAEKANDNATDPGLLPVGRQRADALAKLLSSSDIQRVFATSARRTQLTAKPTADAIGKPVELNDDPGAVAAAIHAASTGTRILVVGHSNTLPQIVRSLGATWSDPDPLETYDRLFVVHVTASGATLDRFRYEPDGRGGVLDAD